MFAFAALALWSRSIWAQFVPGGTAVVAASFFRTRVQMAAIVSGSISVLFLSVFGERGALSICPNWAECADDVGRSNRPVIAAIVAVRDAIGENEILARPESSASSPVRELSAETIGLHDRRDGPPVDRQTVRAGCANAVPLPCCDLLDDPGADQRRSEEHTSELQSLMRISYAVL